MDEEWQKAARGCWKINKGKNSKFSQRHYTWGNEFNPNRCNSGLSNIGHTTTVDSYFNSRSIYGLIDMIGNVWEWIDKSRAKGGSWNSKNKECFHISYLVGPLTGSFPSKDIGFRIVKDR